MEVHLAAAADATAPPSTGIPAPYGRACANCSRAKCRCIYRSNGNDCERCHRLSKECRPSIPVRRKAAASSSAAKRSSSLTLSRTAQLEQKLDGLVSLLEAQTKSRGKAASATASASANALDKGGRGSAANSHTSPVIGHATSAAREARRAYMIPAGSPNHGPDEFRPLGPGGPDFGCGIVPHHNGLPLGDASSSASSRTGTNETRASSVSLRDVPYGEESGHMMAAQCVGTQHMPRTPESSTSSSGPGAGSKKQNKQQNTQQQDRPPLVPHRQQQQQQQQQQQEQPGLPLPVPPTLGWGFSCFSETPRPRELQATGADAGGQDGSPARDTLNLDPSLEPTPAEAEQSLHTFRTTMLPYFPYVYLPPDLTAAQLRQNRPVLWLAIMSITCQRVPTHTQLARSTHLRALFAQRVVFESEKSLDLLQALLAFLTWVHYTSKRDRPTLSVMSQLAVSLVYDLGLHKNSSPCKSLIARLVRDHYQQSLTDDPPMLPPLLDERRAALAAYVLTSKFSIALKRCEPLKWTTRLEEHLHELAANAETPLDHVLATQVRLQRLADHIHQGEWQLNDPAYSDMSPSMDASRLGHPDCRLLPPYVVRVVRAKIEEIRDNIPHEARNYEGVLDALYATEMMLCAGAVLPIVAPVASMASIAIISVRARSKPLTRPDKPLTTNANPSSANGDPRASSSIDFARVAALERCVESVANFWAFFRQLTSGSYAALPFAFFVHFTHCVVLLYGLSVIDEPNWDRAAVRDRLHVLDMLDGFIAKLRDAPRVGPSTSVTGTEAYDVFNRAAIMMSSVRELWATDMGRPDHRERSRAAAVAAASAVVSKDRQDQEAPVPSSSAVAAVPPMLPLGNGPMTLDAPASAAGTAWPLAAVAATAAAPSTADTADMAMGDTGGGLAGPTGPAPDPIMLPSNDEFFADLSTAMIPDDYMFWELFLDGLPQSQL